MEKNKTIALKILNTVCNKNQAENFYKDLEQMKFGKDTAIDIMIEFFKPVKKELWGLHFGAFYSYLQFLSIK